MSGTYREPNRYREIGKGFCGSVWSLVVSPPDHPYPLAIKREDGGPGRSVRKDSDILKHIQHVLSNRRSTPHPVQFCIPRWKAYIDSHDAFRWEEYQLALFPEPRNTQPCNALVQERVMPFTEDIRHKLVDRYCPESLRSRILNNASDQDCLIRPYLGKRQKPRANGPPKLGIFTLRNFPMHIDRLEDEALDLDIKRYARIMAQGLAVLYWEAHVDANDVEFVLAPARHGEDETRIIHSDFLGPHTVWIIDFDCCRHMEMSEEGVTQAVSAFWRNDPFCPRPGKQHVNDQRIWSVFRTEFQEQSRRLLRDTQLFLATLWVEMVEDGVGKYQDL